ADRLAQLAQHLRLADVVEVDAPLGVVAGGGAVVVALVDLADLLRRCGGRHGGEGYALSRQPHCALRIPLWIQRPPFPIGNGRGCARGIAAGRAAPWKTLLGLETWPLPPLRVRPQVLAYACVQ